MTQHDPTCYKEYMFDLIRFMVYGLLGKKLG